MNSGKSLAPRPENAQQTRILAPLSSLPGLLRPRSRYKPDNRAPNARRRRLRHEQHLRAIRAAADRAREDFERILKEPQP